MKLHLRNLACGLLALGLLAAVPARAERTLWAVSYDFALPTYTMRTFINDMSYRGLNIESRYLLKKDLSIGLDFRWNGFNEHYDLATLQLPAYGVGRTSPGAISGPVYNYINTWEALASGHYYLADGAFRPYVSLGVGVVWVYRKSLVADFAFSDTTAYFAAVPEVGAMIQMRGGPYAWGLLLNARYNITTASFARVENMQYLSFAVGAYWLE